MQQFLAPPKPRYALLPLTRLPTANDGRITSSTVYKRKIEDDEGGIDEEDEVDDEEREVEWNLDLPGPREKKKKSHGRKFRRSPDHMKNMTISEAVHDQRLAAYRKEAYAAAKLKEDCMKHAQESEQNTITLIPPPPPPPPPPVEKPRTFVLVPPGPPDIVVPTFSRYDNVNSKIPDTNNFNVNNDINRNIITNKDNSISGFKNIAVNDINYRNNNANNINFNNINGSCVSNRIVENSNKRFAYPDGWRPLPPLTVHGSQKQLPRVYNVPRERIYYELHPHVYDLFACKCASDRNFLLHEVMDRLSEPDLIVVPGVGATASSSSGGRSPHPCIMVSSDGMSRLCSSVQKFADNPSVAMVISIVSNMESREDISSLLKQGELLNPIIASFAPNPKPPQPPVMPSFVLLPPASSLASSDTPPLQLPPLLPPALSALNSKNSALSVLTECNFLCSNLKRRLGDLSLPGKASTFPPAKLLAAECSSQITQISSMLTKLSADIKILQNFEEYGNPSASLTKPLPHNLQRPLPPISTLDSAPSPPQVQQLTPQSIQKQKKKRGRPPLNPNVVGEISLSQINTNK